MRGLGVGLVYWPELEPLFQEGREAVSVLELEPQTLWEKRASADGEPTHYRVNRAALERVAALPQHKLVHGVGHPIGGTVNDPLDHATPFAEALHVLEPAWASEHLSFNRIAASGQVEQTSFLLPPRQTEEGAAQAVHNIRRAASTLPVPFAFETGVNYLRPRADEMSDGAFFGSIARDAPCGIVLDLHNLWANERNGRQPVAAVLEEIPLDRVWEIHLAGGMELDGYWLDAHSGAIPPALLDLTAALVPRLPNLGALIFEILPQYIPALGLDGVAAQLEMMKGLWALRPADLVTIERSSNTTIEDAPSASSDVATWECSVAALALGRGDVDDQFGDLAADPGTDILRQLVTEFRLGRIARGMRYTLTLLLVTRGPLAVRRVLERYCRTGAPDLFTAVECDAFARFLLDSEAEANGDSVLAQVLRFEHALVRASLRGETTVLTWRADPVELLHALDQGQNPVPVPCEGLVMRIG